MKNPPSAFARFAGTRRSTLGLVECLSQAQLDFSPGRRKWSVGEVLDHLVRVDRAFRDDFEELLRRSRRRRGGKVSVTRSLADVGLSVPMVPKAFLPLFDVPVAMAGVFVPRRVREAIFRNRAVPAKAPSRIRPTAGRAATELLRELEAFAGYVEGLSGEHPGIDWSRLRYYNPVTGFTDLPGVLSVMGSHERRHQEQIREIARSSRFPAAA